MPRDFVCRLYWFEDVQALYLREVPAIEGGHLTAGKEAIFIKDYRPLSAGDLRVLRAVCKSPCHALASSSDNLAWDKTPAKSRPRAEFLIVRHQAGNRRAIFEQHKGDVLIMSPVDAISEVARRLGNADGRLYHKSDYQILKRYQIVRLRSRAAVVSGEAGGFCRAAIA